MAAQALLIRTKVGLGYFLASRVLTGSFAGSSPVSKAYLADLGQKDGKLTKYLALRDAASTMAFIMGPLIGGVMFDIRRRIYLGSVVSPSASLAFTIGISAAASLLASALVTTLVTEKPPNQQAAAVTGTSTATTDQKEEEETEKAINVVTTTTPKDKKGSSSSSSSSSGKEESITAPDFDLISCPLGNQIWAGVATICLVSFLFNVGDSTFHAFFSALLKNRAGMDTKSIGLMYTGLACASFSVSATFSGNFVKRFGPVAACTVGLSMIGSGLSVLGLCSKGTASVSPLLAVIAATVYYCGVPLYSPTVPTMLLQCVPPYRRGAVMGLDGGINTLGRVLAPLVMGEFYRRYGSAVAFGLAGTLVFWGAGTALFRRLFVLREQNRLNNGKKAA